MRKKILFAVMALLTMATGKIWADNTQNAGGTTIDGSTAYVVYDEDEKDKTLYFLCVEKDEISEVESSNTIKVNGGTKEVTLITSGDEQNCWRGEAVLKSGSYPGWKKKEIYSKVTKVVIEESFENALPISCSSWFSNFDNLTQIDGLEHLNTSYVTTMYYMFAYSPKLTSLDLSNFDTSNVTTMEGMFNICSSLTSLTFGDKFDTPKVISMKDMFYKCENLLSLDLSKFNISKTTDIKSMFYKCTSLLSLTFGDINTSDDDTSSNFMFDECKKLRLLDLSKAIGDYFTTIVSKLPGGLRPLIYVPNIDNIPTWLNDKKNIVYLSDNKYKCVHLVIDNDNTNANQLLLKVPYEFTADKITINRNFKKGEPHTLYLPFTMDAKAYGKFYKYGMYNPKNGNVTFNELADATTTTEVNTPYLFMPNDDGAIEFTVEDGITVEVNFTKNEGWIDGGANAEADDGNGLFIGVYEKKTFTEEEVANDGIYYGWAEEEFKKVGTGARVDACRAYLKLPKADASNAPARLSVQFGDGDTTGIKSAESGADGGADAPVYNLQGQRVDASYKGLVIKNGRKVIVK